MTGPHRPEPLDIMNSQMIELLLVKSVNGQITIYCSDASCPVAWDMLDNQATANGLTLMDAVSHWEDVHAEPGNVITLFQGHRIHPQGPTDVG